MENSCFDKTLKVLIILGFISVACLLINLIGLGFVYEKMHNNVYHTSFVNQDIIKQLYGVDIQYDKNRRKIEVIVTHPDDALINKIIK